MSFTAEIIFASKISSIIQSLIFTRRQYNGENNITKLVGVNEAIKD